MSSHTWNISKCPSRISKQWKSSLLWGINHCFGKKSKLIPHPEKWRCAFLSGWTRWVPCHAWGNVVKRCIDLSEKYTSITFIKSHFSINFRSVLILEKMNTVVIGRNPQFSAKIHFCWKLQIYHKARHAVTEKASGRHTRQISIIDSVHFYCFRHNKGTHRGKFEPVSWFIVIMVFQCGRFSVFCLQNFLPPISETEAMLNKYYKCSTFSCDLYYL